MKLVWNGMIGGGGGGRAGGVLPFFFLIVYASFYEQFYEFILTYFQDPSALGIILENNSPCPRELTIKWK